MSLSRNPLLNVPAEVAELAGAEFMQRLAVAVQTVQPMTPEVAAAFARGPEISGGTDVEPEDLQPRVPRSHVLGAYKRLIRAVDDSLKVEKLQKMGTKHVKVSVTFEYTVVLDDRVAEEDWKGAIGCNFQITDGRQAFSTESAFLSSMNLVESLASRATDNTGYRIAAKYPGVAQRGYAIADRMPEVGMHDKGRYARAVVTVDGKPFDSDDLQLSDTRGSAVYGA